MNEGIYSTPKQWDPLAGTVKPGSPLYRLPDWIPGARTLAQAKKNCRLAPLTAGGTVSNPADPARAAAIQTVSRWSLSAAGTAIPAGTVSRDSAPAGSSRWPRTGASWPAARRRAATR
ncbi:MAG TPA: hypothetical protein VFQ68_07255 [Streptosporangiaceae bacterium]|nr:hypothetical protein [Streptosporangiaceae bacterium]